MDNYAYNLGRWRISSDRAVSNARGSPARPNLVGMYSIIRASLTKLWNQMNVLSVSVSPDTADRHAPWPVNCQVTSEPSQVPAHALPGDMRRPQRRHRSVLPMISPDMRRTSNALDWNTDLVAISAPSRLGDWRRSRWINKQNRWQIEEHYRPIHPCTMQ